MNTRLRFASVVGLVSLLMSSCGTSGSGASTSATGAAAPAGDKSYGPLDHVTAKYKKLVVEVDHVKGRDASQKSLDGLSGELEKLRSGGYLHKDAGGITFTLDEELPANADPSHVYTLAELDALAKAHRTIRPPDDASYIHMVYVDGHYQDDGADTFVLGFAYGGYNIVMLKDNVKRACEGSAALPAVREKLCELTEGSVLLHELGHLFGLVDNGVTMTIDHKDKDHGAHDASQDCIMYWLNEKSSIVDLIARRLNQGNESMSPFDANCLNDLRNAK